MEKSRALQCTRAILHSEFNNPALVGDAIFQPEMRQLEDTFQQKQDTLRLTRNLTQAKIVVEARLRNGMIVVTAPMHNVAE